MKMIEVDALTVKYGKLRAVDRVSFSVFEQEIFGIVGPNGAGKTSTVECIGGLRRAYSGRVSVSGLDPWKNRQELYGVIGVQLQDTAYQDQVRVGEICALFSSLYRSPAPYGELLEIMQLSGKRRAFVSSLSGGERQKLAIVLALIPNPRIAFLDELTTGLDPHARHQMWDLLLKLRERGLTIVLVSHYMDEVEAVCDRVAIMNRGQMLTAGSITEVIDGFDLQTEISFRSSLEQTGGLEKLPGVTSAKRRRNRITVQGRGDETVLAVLQYLKEQGAGCSGLAVKPPGLEAVFLNLVGYSPFEEGGQVEERGVR
jgi:ABC-2 type transport system ATP-binding protein